MKRILLILLLTLVAFPAIQSCKKGENDPAISLMSRKARLIGKWELQQGTETVLYSDGTSKIITYNGSQKTTGFPGFPSVTVVYTKQFTINRDGTYTSSITDDTDFYSEEGAWYFCPGNKELDIKNKETVAFSTMRYLYAMDGGTQHEINMQGTHAVGYPYVYQIDRLTNKELVILIDEFYGTENGSYTTKGTLTYKKM
ncbi:MAG TPA: hypothetical protein PKW80_15945 [Bacteroidales bacterium]|nr:hypothetical protein [Bacteroidales bacterium]